MKDCTPTASTIVSKIGAPVQADVTANKSSLLAMADGFVVSVVANLLFGWLVKILPTLLGWAIDAALDFFGDVTIADLVTMIATHKQQKLGIKTRTRQPALAFSVPSNATLGNLASLGGQPFLPAQSQPPSMLQPHGWACNVHETDDKELRAKLESWSRLLNAYDIDTANDLAKTLIPEMEKRGYVAGHSSVMVGQYAYYVAFVAGTKHIERVIWNPTL